MKGFRLLLSIARYEMLLLVRAWTFRIFSLLAFSVATLVTVAVALPRDTTFFFNRALSGAFPLPAVKLFNVFLGLISVFLASEFLKRDRRHDTAQVYFTHSFSNGTYILGKFLGIFSLIFILNVLVLLVTGIIHAFFSRTPFAWPPYVIYLLLVGLPTAIFMVGFSVFLGSLIRSQAVVYLLALVYAFFVLVVAGPTAFFAFDSFAYFTPVMLSDFIGLGNLADLLLVRGAYAALGLALILASTLFMKRLRQASFLNKAAAVLAIGLAAAAAVLFTDYVRDKTDARAFRAGLIARSAEAAARPAATLASCDIRMEIRGGTLGAEADLVLVNANNGPLESVLLTLNPGLKVSGIRGIAGPMAFEQSDHLIALRPAGPLAPGQEFRITVAYSGEIDERYCYLDIPDSRYWGALRFWLVSVPKRYAVVTDGFIHLTPESGWYPRAGLPPSLMFPKAVKQDFTRYSLTVTVPDGLTAVSQGAATMTSGKGGEKVFIFKTDGPVPQISLTAGRYVRRLIVVDGTEYSLSTLAGHDQFLSMLSELTSDLPSIIRQARNEYEGLLGLDYPFKRFALVEVPIQIASYGRLWNTAQEPVQPEIIYLPERGALCTGADFWSVQRASFGPRGGGETPAAARGGAAPARGAGQAPAAARGVRGQAATLNVKDLQRALLNRFVRFNLTELAQTLNAPIRAGLLGIQFETNFESRFGIFPQFVTYATHFAAPDWPLFDYVMDAYLRGRVTSQAGPGLRLAQETTVQEETSKILADHSLGELLAEKGPKARPLAPILEAKSRQLLAIIQARLRKSDFDAKLTEWIKGLRFRTVTEPAIQAFFEGLGETDLRGLLSRWSEDKGVPGFVFGNLESYRVVDKEKQKAQLRFDVANPTDTPGVIKIEFMTRGAMGGGRMAGGGSVTVVTRGGGGGQNITISGGAGAAAERRYFVVPARTVKHIGLVLDQPAVMTTIDTYVSRNLPPSFRLPFMTTPDLPGAVAFDGENESPYDADAPGAGGETIVDDEDPGFRTPEGERENWLRRFIRKTFPAGVDEESEFAQFRSILNPPGQWTAIIMQNFYGRFVRSAYFKKSGNGQSRVSWTAELRESGEYDISFYHGNILGGPAAVGGMRGGDMGGGRGGFAGGPGMGGGRGGVPMGQRGQSGVAAPMGQRGGQPPAAGTGLPARFQPGKKHFLIHSMDGTEEVVVDLKDAQAGWNLIGTFRLAAGPNTIELTDRNESIYVMADAVQWARHKDLP